MHETHISRADLNLLPALLALLQERHISRAAQRIGLSQSATSRSLQRLRREFGDDLLVRGKDGFTLTTRAEEILAALLGVLPALEAVFDRGDFVPASATERFELVGTDYAVSVCGAALFRRILSESTGSSVRFHPWHPQVFAELESGRLDLIFFGARAPAPLLDDLLFTDSFVCVVAHDHPLATGTTITLADYLRGEHMVIDIDNGLQPAVDRVLLERGTPRHAAVTIPYHAAAPHALVGTSLVLTMPSRMLTAFVTPLVDSGALRIFDAPRIIRELSYFMAWHPRVTNDPAHRWLRSQVRASVAERA